MVNHRKDGIAAVTMARDIRPLNSEDLPELSRFLATGFHAQPGADFSDPVVLRWKYLEPKGFGSIITRDVVNSPTDLNRQEQLIDSNSYGHAPLSFVALNESKKIVGHVGLCRTYFRGKGICCPSGQVRTMHIIDWLGSAEQRAIGISLMRLSHEGVETQFGLGVSQSALVAGERAGYRLQGLIPVYNRVLRARYWLRKSSLAPLERGLRLARDAADRLIQRPSKPNVVLILERVSTFGSEVCEVATKAERHVILTERGPARLNAFLRFPRQDFSGWYLRDVTGRIRGFALLNLVPHDEGRTRTGKIVDCLLDEVDVPLWQAALLALTPLARTCTTGSRCGSVLCLHKVDVKGAFSLWLCVTIRGQIPHPRSSRFDSARGDVSSHDSRRRLRLHVIFRGILNKREFVAQALRQLGVIGLLERVAAARRPTLVVLTYHRIAKRVTDQFYDPVISASPQSFRTQVEWLHKHMRILTLLELDDQLRAGGTWNRTISTRDLGRRLS